MNRRSPTSGKGQSNFPWNPPPTISQRMTKYKRLRFIRPGARSPLPEDLVEHKRVSIK